MTSISTGSCYVTLNEENGVLRIEVDQGAKTLNEPAIRVEVVQRMTAYDWDKAAYESRSVVGVGNG